MLTVRFIPLIVDVLTNRVGNVGLSRKHMPIMELGCLLFSTKCGAQS